MSNKISVGERIELGSKVREIISDRMGNISNVELARRLAPPLDKSVNYLKHMIQGMRSNTVTGYLPVCPAKSKGMEILTAVLYYLGVNEDDNLVQKLKSYYPRMAYPPENYEKLPRREKID